MEEEIKNIYGDIFPDKSLEGYKYENSEVEFNSEAEFKKTKMLYSNSISYEYMMSKKDNTIVYTNKKTAEKYIDNLMNYIIEKIGITEENIDEKKELLKIYIENLKILDGCCGTGNLTIVLIEWIINYKNNNNLKIDIKKIIENIWAIDIDVQAIKIMKFRIKALCVRYKLGANININAEVKNIYDVEEEFDIIVSNPPYGKTSKKDNEYDKSNSNSNGQSDVGCICINFFLEKLLVNGLILIISDSKVWRNDCAEYIRNMISEKFHIIIFDELSESEGYEKKVQVIPNIALLEKRTIMTIANGKCVKNILGNKKKCLKIATEEEEEFVNKIKQKAIALDEICKLEKYKNREKTENDRKKIEGKELGTFKIISEVDKKIIIPEICEKNKFTFYEGNRNGKPTILEIKTKEGNDQLLKYLFLLLNSKVYYAYLIIIGKRSKDKLRVTVDVLKEIYVKKEFDNRLVEEYFSKIKGKEEVKNEEKNLEDEINKWVIDIYEIEDYVTIIDNIIQEYEKK